MKLFICQSKKMRLYEENKLVYNYYYNFNYVFLFDKVITIYYNIQIKFD